MSRKVDIVNRNPTVFFSPQLFQGGAAPGSQSRTLTTFIAGRNGLPNQESAGHPKATCPQTFSVANSTSAIGPSNYAEGQSAIAVLLTNCCSLYPKLVELNLLMSSNEPTKVTGYSSRKPPAISRSPQIKMARCSKMPAVLEK